MKKRITQLRKKNQKEKREIGCWENRGFFNPFALKVEFWGYLFSIPA
jgi:hypothetical protein